MGRAKGIAAALAAALACSLAISGCASPAQGGEAPEIPTDNHVAEHSELFVDKGDGAITFETNDGAYVSPTGYTLWTPNGATQEPFVERETKLTKLSGDDIAGYGIVICQYDTGDPYVGMTMLVLMIRTDGDYIVGEVNGSTFTALFPWTPSAALVSGYNQANTVKVALESGEFVVSINGTEVKRFRDEAEPYHTHGADGYLTVISPYEDFPEVPVKVLFQDL